MPGPKGIFCPLGLQKFTRPGVAFFKVPIIRNFTFSTLRVPNSIPVGTSIERKIERVQFLDHGEKRIACVCDW